MAYITSESDRFVQVEVADPARSGVAKQAENFVNDRIIVGHWVLEHYQAAARERGVATVARQLRKQGYPAYLAVLILAGAGPSAS